MKSLDFYMKRKRYRLGFLVFLCLVSTVIIWNLFKVDTSPFSVQTEASPVAVAQLPESLELREDPASENPLKRMEYEFEMLKDPKTNKVPLDIRTKELAHVKEMKMDKLGFFNIRSTAYGVSASQASSFVNKGPYNVGGRTRAVAIDVDNESVILAGGVSGGVWRTTNSGASWTRTTSTDFLPSVTSIVQDHREGKTNNWYYGSGEFFGNSGSVAGAFYFGDGVFKSTNDGESWTLIQETATGNNVSPSKFGFVNDIVIDNSNLTQTEIYVAGASEIIRTTDDFKTFSTVLGATNTGQNATDVLVTPTGTVIASIANASGNGGSSAQEGVFISADGISWTKLTFPTGFPNRYSRIELAIDPQNEDLVYMVGSDFLYQYNRTTDAWKNLTTNLNVSQDSGQGHNSQSGYNLIVKVHPNSPSVLFVGGTNLLRSTDLFATNNNRATIGGYQKDDNPNSFPNYPNHHPDQHSLAFFPSDPNKMLSGSDGGVHLTSDNKINTGSNPVVWQPLNNGYITSQFYAVDILRSVRGSDVMVGGIQDNGSWGVFNADPAANWQQIFGGDGSYNAVTYNSLYVSAQEGQMRRFELVGTTYTSRGDISPADEDDDFLFINPFTFDPVNQDKMFVAAKGRVYYTNDIRLNPAAGDWEQFSGLGLDDDFVSAFGTSVQPEGVLYFGTRGGKVFKVADTRNITSAQNITASNLPAGSITSIAVDPRNANRVFLTFGNYGIVSVWMSENGGASWSNIAGNLEDNADGSGNGPSVRWVELLPDGNSGELIFLGTSTGLFMTKTLNGTQTTWTQQATDVIGNAIVNMVKVRPADGRVVAATHGNGVFVGSYDVGFSAEINYSYQGTSSAVIRATQSAVNGQGFAYTWLKDGAELEGKNDYELTVTEPGTYQCRVRDELGPVALSNLVEIDFTEAEEGTDPVTGIDDPFDFTLKVGPNPSSGVFNVQLSSEYAKGFEFKVIDSNGRIITSGEENRINIEEPFKIDLSNQPDGLYILNLANSDKRDALKLLKRSR